MTAEWCQRGRDRKLVIRDDLLRVSSTKIVRTQHGVPAYLSKSSNPQVLPQNELPDLNRRLLHGEDLRV